jgi:hypothetical protein
MTTTEVRHQQGRLTVQAAIAGSVGALLQISGGILETVDRVHVGEPGFTVRTAIIGVAYLLLAVSVIGLMQWRPGLGGTAGHLSWWALGVAAGGWIMSAVAQFTLPAANEFAEQVLFPVATVLIGLGMAVAGVVALRVRRDRSPWFMALVCGLYPFLVIFPVFAVNGGPQFLVLTGWGLCWLLLATGAYRRART